MAVLSAIERREERMKKRIFKWEQLTKDQRYQVIFGDACGHLTNRPKNYLEAARRLWIIDENQNVIGWRI